MSVRVRFAPSPTGPLHIGGVRTALYNYLFAKKHNGTFILRIEDTDQKRYVEGAEQYIIDSLKWCGIAPDEGMGAKDNGFGPYRQSDRKEIYKKYTQELIDKNWAYYAFDTAEELDQLRSKAEATKNVFSYDASVRLNLNNSLNLSAEELQTKLDTNQPYVIRFKIPENQKLILNDMVRGMVKINTATLDDKVLFKSDGMPTYHLANIVDDHLMEITHVIRGEEWLPSLALHHLLYKAFDWKSPEFAHLPLILKPVGKGKLSKRDGDKLGFPVFPLEWTNTDDSKSIGYKEEGYFNDAFINMLALLGWNPGTEQEIFSLDELVTAFDIHKVSKSGARFSPDKTNWFNHKYMQLKSNEYLSNYYLKIAKENDISVSKEKGLKAIELVKERAVFAKDLWRSSSFLFENPKTYDAKTYKKTIKEETKELLSELVSVLKNVSDWNEETLANTIKPWITEKGVGFGKVMQPLRLALVGSMSGPDLFIIMNFIGKDSTLERLNHIINS